jgi:signal transduction histidine kinase
MYRFLLILLLSWGIAAAQPVNLDSLELFLKREDVPAKSKVDILNDIARDLSYVNPVKSAEISYRALELSKQINYSRGEAYALRGAASNLIIEDHYYLALKNINQAMRLFEQNDDSTGIIDCYISLGHVYRRLRNLEKEFYYNHIAYKYFNRHGPLERIGVATHNLGETYLNKGDLGNALHLTQKAIRLNDSLGRLAVLSSCYKTLGSIMLKKGEDEQATQFFKKVLSISKQLGENSQKVATTEALLQLAILAKKNKNYQEANLYLEQATSIIREFNLFDYVTPVLNELIDIYSLQNTSDGNFEMIRKFKSTNDSLTQIKGEVMNRFTEMFMKTDTLETTNIALQEKSLFQERLLIEKSNRNRLTVAFLLLLITLAIILTIGVVKLRKANNYLIAQRTIIQTQNKQLEELNNLKDKFLSILSHDIKAPLVGLKSYADLLTNENLQLERAQLMQFGKELKEQLTHTSSLADNLIMWVKLQMRSFATQPTRFDLSQTIQQVCNLYQPLAEQKKIHLRCSGIHSSAFCEADRNQIDFIVRNLVQNALKYSFSGGEIHVRLTTENQQQIVSVTDHGTGMSKEVMDSIISKKAMPSTEGTEGEGGSGLGLRICSEFASLNKGRIEIESEKGKGSTCRLILPTITT